MSSWVPGWLEEWLAGLRNVCLIYLVWLAGGCIKRPVTNIKGKTSVKIYSNKDKIFIRSIKLKIIFYMYW